MNLLRSNSWARANESAAEVLTRVAQAQTQVHRLVLLVGGARAGKTLCLREVAARTGDATIVNVGLELSYRLLELPAPQRERRAAALLQNVVESVPTPILLDNTEVLFASSLKLQPLNLLRQLARDRTVVATWRGSVSGHRLNYGEPGHPEHRRSNARGVLIVDLEADAARTTT